MFARRRPLLRAAAVGGAAYMAGKSRAQHQAEAEQAEAAQAGQPGQPAPAATGPGPAQAPGGGPAGGLGSAVTDQLSRLASLHQQGALTDAEFAAAKAKLLGT